MKRVASSFVALLCFSLIALETRANAKEQWTRVRSENFTLVGNASERDIRDVATKLEQYRSILARLFNEVQISQTLPTTVIVFKDDRAFKPFRPLYQGRLTDVAGYFQPGRDLHYIAVSAEKMGDQSFGTIFHELVHLFVDNNLRGLPLCFNEGLAEYFSSVKISDDGSRITLGSASVHRIRLLNEKTLLPLQTLLATDYDSDYYNEGDQRSIFYAQSWALVHYLLHQHNQNGLERFTRFLGLLSHGSSIDEGLKEVFDSNIAELETALTAYVRRQPYPSRLVSLERMFADARQMQSSEITFAEAQAYVGDLLLHLNRVDEAEEYLQGSLALNPDLVMAQASLGMLRIKQRRMKEAVDILRRAAASDPKNSLTQYYYAFAISREGMDAQESVRAYTLTAASEMRAALGRAIELSPNYIEAYKLQAFVNLVLNEHLDDAEKSLQRALVLSQGRQDLMLLLAQVHLRGLKFQAARKDLEPILQRADDIKLREQASSLLEDITFAEDQASRPDYFARKNAELASNRASQDATSAQEQAHAARPRLAKRFKGERVQGLLTGIECMDSGVALFVKVGKQTLRLHAPELRSVFFVTYVAGLERTVTCGARKANNLVVLTYRSRSEPRGNFDGEAIAIEFVPEDIDIEP